MSTAVKDLGKPRFVMMELGQLKRWPKNPKGHDLGFLGKAFKKNGFAEFPTIDEGTGKMVAGHGRVEKLEAMKAAGEEAPARVEVRGGKWFIPVVRGMTFPDPAAHVVASNRGVELGGWESNLAAFLRDQVGIKNLDGTGFSEENYAAFLRGASAPDQFTDVSGKLETDYCCPKCNYQWSGDPKPASAKPEKAPKRKPRK